MKRIVVTGLIGIRQLVRRGNNQNAAGFEDAFKLTQHLLMFVVMLDSFERCDRIDGCIGKRNRVARARSKRKVRIAIGLTGAQYSSGIDVDAGNKRSARRQQRGSITFPRSDVENGFTRNEL